MTPINLEALVTALDPEGKGGRRHVDDVATAIREAAAHLDASAVPELVRDAIEQHEQLGVLGQIRPGQHRQRAQQIPQQPVDERRQHPATVPATPLFPQQKSSSQHKTGFPSGTG